MIADDLGRNDLGCYGNKFIETPNIDRIARRSILFDQAYGAAPVCSPTRASIFTGQYPARLGLTNFIDGRRTDSGSSILPAPFLNYFPAGIPNMPRTFKAAGYQTALIGKWHLGENTRPEASHPLGHGFDIALHHDYGLVPEGESYVWIKGTDTTGNRYRLPAITDMITSDAVQYLDTVANPFLLFITHYNPHLPLQPKPELAQKYQNKLNPYGSQQNPLYAAMVEELDGQVGKIWQKLEDRNLISNTIFIFISDNGGVVVEEAGEKQPTTMAPYRSGKGTLFDGGIRIPQIIYHPSLRKGKHVGYPTSTVDFFATMVGWCELPEPGFTQDGQSFAQAIEQKDVLPIRPLFWHYPHFSNQGGRPAAAIRLGNYKLIRSFETNEVMLFNLEKDPGETTDLKKKLPEKARRLKEQLNRWLESVHAKPGN
ncbi:MAG: sulfatase [Chitinophagaceae bacterium]|nr:sulfatase [Chitinophagaceae bacterium]